MMTVKVPGIYYVSVMFGVTKKAWYLHLRKNGVYIASVQKDYNAGYEDSLNLHAIGPVLKQSRALDLSHFRGGDTLDCNLICKHWFRVTRIRV